MKKDIDFIGLRYKCMTVSLLVILLGVAAFAVRGGLNYGIDFSGGTKIIMKFAQPVTSEYENSIRSCLEGLHLQGSVQSFEDNGIVIQTKGSQYTDAVAEALIAARTALGKFQSDDEIRESVAEYSELGIPELVMRTFTATPGLAGKIDINTISPENLQVIITKEINSELAGRIKNAVGLQLGLTEGMAAEAGKVDINGQGDSQVLTAVLRREVAVLLATTITGSEMLSGTANGPVSEFSDLDPLLQPLGFNGEIFKENFLLREPRVEDEIQLNLNTVNTERLAAILNDRILNQGKAQRDLSASADQIVRLLDIHDGVLADVAQTQRLDLPPAVRQVLAERFYALPFIVQSVEMVGPRIGHDLRQRAFYAIVFALGGILIYISWRFQFKYAVGAIIALTHDVLITIGILVMMNREFDLTVIAALLTIIGYSLNDTIIVYDRIREQFRSSGGGKWEPVINTAINKTLGRTIKTSLTTLVVVLAFLIYGSMVTFNFALAIVIGIVVGTYSSIFIAAPALIEWHNYFEKKS